MRLELCRRFTYYILIFLLVLVGNSFVFAQKKSSDNKSCLWKIKSKHNTVYLLGSIHFLKKESYPLKDSMENAFYDAQKLAFEINLDSAETLNAQKLILTKAMYSNGNTLKKSINEETYNLVKKKGKELGIEIAQFNNFKPWFFTITLLTLKLQKLGFAPSYSIDKYFFNKAKQADKEIISFESIEYQIGLFDALSDKNQELLILQTLKEFDIFDKELNKIVSSWTNGDSNGLENTLLRSFKEVPELYGKFIFKRNLNWLPQIESFLKDNKNYLVVVGAGHLIGDDGIIKLLEDKGYSIEQL